MKNRILIVALMILSVQCLKTPSEDPPPPGHDKNLPVIRIITEYNAPISNRADWVTMTFSLTDPNNPKNNIAEIRNHQIRGRGNVSWFFPKKSYRIRFRSGREQSLLGLPAARNWVLLAEFMDPTFLMNAVAFELGRNVFDLPFTCTYHHVHVYINHYYAGLYGLAEHRQVDPAGIGAPGRVKVDLPEGWFVEMDSYYDAVPKFRTTDYNLPIMIKTNIFGSDSNDPGYDYVKNDWNELCRLMASETFPENGYRDLIDLNNFVDYIMINDIVLNGELYHPKSVFAYKKDNDSKISLGPLWDFDWAYGYVSGHRYFSDYPHQSLEQPSGSRDLPKHRFFQRFFEDPVFVTRYKERWNEKYNEIAAVSSYMDDARRQIRSGVEDNYQRWAYHFWNGYDHDHTRQISNLKGWYERRINWLNTQINLWNTDDTD